MMKTSKDICLVFLALLYVTVASGTLIAQLTLPAISSGPIEVRECKGTTKEPGKPVWTIRRHLPMIKEGSKSPILLADATVYDNPREYAAFFSPERVLIYHHPCSFTLSNRAPPLS